MRPEHEYREAIRLIGLGINDTEIGRRLDVPPRTIQNWRSGLAVGNRGRTAAWSGKRWTPCFRCDGGGIDERAYAYLLGVYLGDGWIGRGTKDVYRLSITCDLKYPGIIDEVARHIGLVRGAERVGFASRVGCVDVYAYWKHWPCVFPQHGPGRKHERKIQLERWQHEIVTREPKALIRGLIHSDGNRHVNKVMRTLPSGPKRYRYSRYMFTNASTDILGIFTDTLDSLGIHWTQTTSRIISVARRTDVALLDTFVGPKR